MGPKKRKCYEKFALQAAIREVTRGKRISKVAKLYGIPRTTLYDHTRGTLQGNSTNPGIAPSLSHDQEQTLVKYIEYMAGRGLPLTTSVLRRFVVAIIQKSGRKSKINLQRGPSKKWCRKFFKRHPEVKRRRPDRADSGRLNVSQEKVEEYFELLGSTIRSLGLENKPNQIFNCDETGFDGHEVSKEKVIVVGKQHPYQKQVFNNLGHITLQLAVSGSGKYLPPMLIFSRCLPRDLDNVPQEWTVVASAKGYMDSDLFVNWLENVFVPHCGKERPVILIMDNLGAHLTPRAIDVAKANQVELLCLPAHSTHLLQPLDVRIFNVVKANLSKAASRVGFQSSRITRAHMPSLIKYALNCLSGNDITEAFRLTGIVPYNPSIIPKLKQKLRQESDGDANTRQQLVDMGIVPADLVDVFIPPPTSACKSSRKSCTSARVITQDPRPSTSRVDTPMPAIIENAANPPASPLNVIAPDVMDEHPDDGICVVCMTNARFEWIGCDRCSNWFHYQCLSYHHQVLVDLSVVTGDDWFCGFCGEE